MKKLIIVISMLLCSAALADAPLSGPSAMEVFSNNKNYVFISDPATWVTSIYEVSKDHHRKLAWSMYGWFRDGYLSDDGEHFVAGYDGFNLIPTDYSKDMVMVYFFEKGRLVRLVKLNEIIKDFGKLETTASHFQWGNCRGINSQGEFVIETVEKKRLLYDVKTGELLKIERVEAE